MSAPFEIPDWGDIEDFVARTKDARKELDEIAASASKATTSFKEGGKKSAKSLKDVGSFISQLRRAAPQLAIVAAVAPDIMDFIGGLTEPFESVGEAMQELGFTASEGFTQMAEDITNSIYDLQPVAENIGMWVGDMYDDVQAKDWDSLSENVAGGLTSAWDNVVDFFEGDALDDVAKGAAGIVNGIGEWLGNITYEDLKTGYTAITDALETFFDNVVWEDVFYSVGQAFYNLGRVLLEGFAEGLQEWYDSQTSEFQDFFISVGQTIGGGFQ